MTAPMVLDGPMTGPAFLAYVQQVLAAGSDLVANMPGSMTFEGHRDDTGGDRCARLERMNLARDRLDQLRRRLLLHPIPFGARHANGRLGEGRLAGGIE